MLQIPLMLQFQTGEKHQLYAAAGGKVGLPLGGRDAACHVSTMQNSGYYAYEDYEYTTQQFMGFGTFTDIDAKDKLSFKTAFFISMEMGAKWKLTEKLYLYTGVYLDYGLNNIVETRLIASLPTFVAYNTANPSDFAVKSIFHSQYTQNGVAQSFTDKITPIAAGLKFRLVFGMSGAAKKNKDKAPDDTALKDAQEEVARKSAQEEVVRKAAVEKAEQEEAARKAAVEKAQQEEADRKAAAEKAATQSAKEQIQKSMTNYALAQTELSEAQKLELDKKITLLQQYTDFRFYIYGHTCNTGTAEQNDAVGLARAEKAKEYLISKGIDEKRIAGVASKRDTEPLAPNTEEASRRENRRVEIVVQ
jgi:outer membrane protein OmpA-like peptidoglycan-associated protein